MEKDTKRMQSGILRKWIIGVVLSVLFAFAALVLCAILIERDCFPVARGVFDACIAGGLFAGITISLRNCATGRLGTALCIAVADAAIWLGAGCIIKGGVPDGFACLLFFVTLLAATVLSALLFGGKKRQNNGKSDKKRRIRLKKQNVCGMIQKTSKGGKIR